MSDSGLPQFPARAASVLPASISPLKAEVKVQVIDASGKLARVEAPRQVTGEVNAINKDGTVQIKTAQGEITVRPRENIYPKEGQTVQLDLAPGAPPRQATLRPAPAPAPLQNQAPNPPQNQGQAASSAPPTNTAPTSENRAPAPVEKPAGRPQIDHTTQAGLTRQQEAQAPLKPAPVPTTPQPLPAEAIVRLTPLPPAQARQLIDQIIQTLQLRVNQAAFMSSAAVKAAMTQELNSLIPALPASGITASMKTGSQTGTPNSAAQLAPTPEGLKNPLTPLNQTLNASSAATALTPVLQNARSPVENFMRQVMTPEIQQGIQQGAVLNTAPATTLSTRIMALAANAPLSALAHFDQGSPLTLPPRPGAQPITTAPSGDLTATAALKNQGFFDGRVQSITPPHAQLNDLMGSGSGATSPMLTIKADLATLIAQPQALPAALNAQVVTMTPQHYPVIALLMPGAQNPAALTPQLFTPQLFTLQFPATNLMPGATFTIIPQPGAAPALPAAPPSPMALLSGFQWPAFEEFAALEFMTLPQMASAQNMAQILPNPAQPDKLPAAALLFIAAAKAGDLNAWLGEKNIESLRRMGKAEFVARMAREFSGLQKLSSEPVNAEWRGMTFPLYSEGQIDKVHLYYRHSHHGEDRDQKQAEKGKGTRFIMDLYLSHMGAVQLDGYTRGQQVDLIVRTQKPFGAGARYEMTQRYIRALEAAGFEGALIFQSQPEKFVNIAARTDLLRQSI